MKIAVSYSPNPPHDVKDVGRVASPDEDVPCVQDFMSENCESGMFEGTCIVKSSKINKMKKDLK